MTDKTDKAPGAMKAIDADALLKSVEYTFDNWLISVANDGTNLCARIAASKGTAFKDEMRNLFKEYER